MLGEDQTQKNLVYYYTLFITVAMPLWPLSPEECEVDNINYKSTQELNSLDENEEL